MKKMLFVLLFFPVTITAQQHGKRFTDSLQKELLTAVRDTDKINILNKLSYAYSTTDFQEGIRWGNPALALARKNKWQKGIGFAFYNLGNSYLLKLSLDTARFYFDQAFEVNKSLHDKTLEARLYQGYGGLYQGKSENEKALEFYQKALQLSEQLHEKYMEGLCLVSVGVMWNILANPSKGLEFDLKGLKISEEINDHYLAGMAYFEMGNVYYYFDNRKAIENYQKAVENQKLCDNKSDMSKALNNMGLISTNLLQFEQALNYHQSALAICKEQSDIAGQGLTLGNIGYVYDNMNNYIKALEYYKQALAIDEKMGVKRQMVDDLNGLGSIYNRIQDSDMVKIGQRPADRYRTALDYSKKSLALAREAGAAKQSDAWKLLSEVYDRQHNYAKAFDAYKNYIVFRDSNINKEKNQEITRKDMQFGFDKKQLSDSLQNEETKKIARLKLQKQQTYTYVAFAGVGMFILLSFFIFKNYSTQKRSNKLLAFEKHKSDSLLLNILPSEVAEELKTKGHAEAKHFDLVTVLFSDFVNFTLAAEKMSPQELVSELDHCFKAFDEIIGKYNIEKIKTIGDAYMAVCGLPIKNNLHAENIMSAALEIKDFMAKRNNAPGSRSFDIRIGIHSGPVVAGIVGTKKFAYDIWGDTVNTAARMEQNSEKGMINISEMSYNLVKDKFQCSYRGEVTAKNKGSMKMYYLEK